MNNLLEAYLQIYKKFPLDRYHTKGERKIRYTMLTEWEHTEITSPPTLDELISFVKEHKNEIQITPQFFKKFKAVWQDDVENGYKFAEFLLENDLEERLMWRLDIEPMHLANQMLKHNPNHTKALKLKLRILDRYHGFCLHEVPWAVLWEGTLEEGLQSVAEMENIAKKLNFQNENLEDLIAYCRRYYPLWFEFLTCKEKYDNSFEKFLLAKGIESNGLHLPYIEI